MAKKTLFLPSRGSGRMSSTEIAQAADLAKDVPIPPQRNPFAKPNITNIIAPGLPSGGGGSSTVVLPGGTSGSAGFSRVVTSNGIVVSLTGPSYLKKTAAYTGTVSDDVILADTTSGGFIVKLPLVATSARLLVYYENIGTNTLTIAASGSDTLNGVTSLPNKFDGCWYYCDGSNWYGFSRGYGKETANTLLAGPTSGAAAFPAFRALVAADMPASVNVTTVNFAASPYTILSTDSYLLCDCSGGNIVLNAPTASAIGRRIVIETKGSSTNTATFTPNGADTIILQSNLGTQGEQTATVYVADGGTNWNVESFYPGLQASNYFMAYPASGGGNGPLGIRKIVGADLPNPSASTLGGIESLAAVGSKWINTISTSGVPSATQPAYTDISGTDPVNQGGTGQTTYTDGQLLIGNTTGNTLAKATITAGSGITVTNGHGTITLTATGGVASVAFQIYAGGTTYTIGNVVQGSDNNLYRALQTTTGNDPTTDAGTNWELWYLRANLTLNCGVGQTFADTYAASGSPGGAMTPGMQTAINFIRNARGCAPAVATVTITQGANPTFSASANGTTTTILTTTNVPIGASIVGLTTNNIGTTNTVTASSFSAGTYTLTVTAWTSTVSGDTYGFAPYYGTTTISAACPGISNNLIIQAATAPVTTPLFYPAMTNTAGGSWSGSQTNYVAITYTWADGSSTTRETMHGLIGTIAMTAGNKMTITGFTLPAGATGANAYISQTLNGAASTWHKQAAFVITAGVAAALVINSYNSGGANPAVVNPSPATYPGGTMTWNSTLTQQGLKFNGMNGFQLTNLYLYGNSNANSNQSGIGVYDCKNVTLGPVLIVSSFDENIYLWQSECHINQIQVDNGTSVNVFLITHSFIDGVANQNSLCLYGQYGWYCQRGSFMTDAAEPLATNATVTYYNAYYCTLGVINSVLMSNVEIRVAAANTLIVWGPVTAYSPTSGSVGNNNSYLIQN